MLAFGSALMLMPFNCGLFKFNGQRTKWHIVMTNRDQLGILPNKQITTNQLLARDKKNMRDSYNQTTAIALFSKISRDLIGREEEALQKENGSTTCKWVRQEGVFCGSNLGVRGCIRVAARNLIYEKSCFSRFSFSPLESSPL